MQVPGAGVQALPVSFTARSSLWGEHCSGALEIGAVLLMLLAWCCRRAPGHVLWALLRSSICKTWQVKLAYFVKLLLELLIEDLLL